MHKRNLAGIKMMSGNRSGKFLGSSPKALRAFLAKC